MNVGPIPWPAMSVIALGAAIAIGATLGSHAVLGFSLLVATAVGVARRTSQG